MGRRHTNGEQVNRYILPVVLFLVAMAMLFFLPPSNVYSIGGLIAVITLLVWRSLLLGTSSRDSALAAIFAGLFLTTCALVGFNMLNTMLLVSFIIGLRLLLGSSSNP